MTSTDCLSYFQNVILRSHSELLNRQVSTEISLSGNQVSTEPPVSIDITSIHFLFCIATNLIAVIFTMPMRRQRCETKPVDSGKEETFVTLAIPIIATGSRIPSVFVFPRKYYREYFIDNRLHGGMGSANKPFLMKSDDFFKILEHFVGHTQYTVERLLLLLLDIKQYHLSAKGIDFPKSYGLIILSFLPHCSHKLQALDKSITKISQHF